VSAWVTMIQSLLGPLAIVSAETSIGLIAGLIAGLVLGFVLARIIYMRRAQKKIKVLQLQVVRLRTRAGNAARVNDAARRKADKERRSGGRQRAEARRSADRAPAAEPGFATQTSRPAAAEPYTNVASAPPRAAGTVKPSVRPQATAPSPMAMAAEPVMAAAAVAPADVPALNSLLTRSFERPAPVHAHPTAIAMPAPVMPAPGPQPAPIAQYEAETIAMATTAVTPDAAEQSIIYLPELRSPSSSAPQADIGMPNWETADDAAEAYAPALAPLMTPAMTPAMAPMATNPEPDLQSFLPVLYRGGTHQHVVPTAAAPQKSLQVFAQGHAGMQADAGLYEQAGLHDQEGVPEQVGASIDPNMMPVGYGGFVQHEEPGHVQPFLTQDPAQQTEPAATAIHSAPEPTAMYVPQPVVPPEPPRSTRAFLTPSVLTDSKNPSRPPSVTSIMRDKLKARTAQRA
jgi:hypothetical protein